MDAATTAAGRLNQASAAVSTEARRTVLLLPLALSVALAAIALMPMARGNPRLMWSILGSAAILQVATAVLAMRAKGRALSLDVQLRSQHYLQACAQSTVLLYWGWYWRPVYEAAPLLLAQLLFAYTFDMLLAWSRRNQYTLGFGPFPVIFSINLFLWFKPDWFYLQFLMIAVGFAAKELIRWEKGGKKTHIFNPSSFPLAVFSLGLILTGSTSITYGAEIATTQFNPPNIYLLLFLVGLPGQFLFGVTTMTMSAVVTTYLFGLAYYALTGTYFFIDSYIPIAVFLGMHLLFTDPSTSPRTELGRIIFGVMYGLGNILLYELLGRAGVPTFYDKLLPVPIMNLSIKVIDRVATSSWLKRFDPAKLGASLAPRRRNLAYMAIWTGVFVVMSVTNGVGDEHPGHKVPFWQKACQSGAPGGCEKLGVILTTYCDDGSGWACNELGVLQWHRRIEPGAAAAANFMRACSAGFEPACQNVLLAPRGVRPTQTAPQLKDYPVVLRTGKGAIPQTTPLEIYEEACRQDWMIGCQSLAALHLRGEGTPKDPVKAAAAFEKACNGGLGSACSNLGYMHYQGDGIPVDREKGVALLKRSCELGFQAGCRWLKELKPTD